jgi:hypothetical protein
MSRDSKGFENNFFVDSVREYFKKLGYKDFSGNDGERFITLVENLLDLLKKKLNIDFDSLQKTEPDTYHLFIRLIAEQILKFISHEVTWKTIFFHEVFENKQYVSETCLPPKEDYSTCETIKKDVITKMVDAIILSAKIEWNENSIRQLINKQKLTLALTIKAVDCSLINSYLPKIMKSSIQIYLKKRLKEENKVETLSLKKETFPLAIEGSIRVAPNQGSSIIISETDQAAILKIAMEKISTYKLNSIGDQEEKPKEQQLYFRFQWNFFGCCKPSKSKNETLPLLSSSASSLQ